MVEARVLVFDKKRDCWDWDETFPAVPRVGETLCFEPIIDGQLMDYEIFCTITEIQWRCDEDVSLLVVAEVNEESTGENA